MNLEDMYTVLRSASANNIGASYDIIKKWFKECHIIENRLITEDHFGSSYRRLAPNYEPLTLVEFIQLIGILSRDTRSQAEDFLKKFYTVRETIVAEIRANSQ